jgi:hypothetical protein
MLRRPALLFLMLVALPARAEIVPPDTTHWSLEGRAEPAEYRGRKCLKLDGAAATLKDFTMRDAVVDMDVATPAKRGFFGFYFRLSEDSETAEWIYFRHHHSGDPDALQYTPVLHTGANWQLYNGPGFTGRADIPKNEWFHVRLEVAGAQAKFYMSDMTKPVLVMDDLKTGLERGGFALYDLAGETYVSNVEVRKTPDVPWQRHLPAMARGTIVKWSISPAYDALARSVEQPLTRAEADTMRWQAVEAEAPGHVVLYRWLAAPHLRVTFANDFSRRLEPQPGTKLVYARTTIESDRDEVRKLELGYSDEVSVFLNGRILWRGRSAQNFRDPAFLGIVNAENDAVYLPLEKGRNELVLALSELGGGWGFAARLVDR